MASPKNKFFSPVLSNPMFLLLPISFVLWGGGLVSCGSIDRLGSNTIEVSNRTVNITKIADIKPTHQSQTTIYLQGKAIVQAPFLSGGAYQLQDESGKIWVMTNQILPSVGDEVTISGEIQFQSIPIDGQELGEVYIQQREELEKKSGQTEASSHFGCNNCHFGVGLSNRHLLFSSPHPTPYGDIQIKWPRSLTTKDQKSTINNQ